MWRGVLTQLIFFVLATRGQYSEANPSADGCQRRCDDMNIPYPFGTSEGCYIYKHFLVTHYNPPRLFLTNSSIPILNISLEGHLHILGDIGYNCYHSKGETLYHKSWLSLSKPLLSTLNDIIGRIFICTRILH